MTREEVLNELKDILAVIDDDGELVAEDSLDALATRLMEEGSKDISEDELDAINGMIYDSFAEPATICNELINMLMSSGIQVEDIEDPLMADMWDDISDEEVAALTTDANYAEFSDHHYQEGCEGGECKEAVEADQDEPKEELPEAEEAKQDVKEGYYGRDSIIAGDIPGKENSFYDLISMRFHNMGYDEETHPLITGKKEQLWNPFADQGVLMVADDPKFFDKIVAYIESEVEREDSAWYLRDYEICEIDNPDDVYKLGGTCALCIELEDFDRENLHGMPSAKAVDYTRRRKMRRANDKVPA